MVLRPVVGPALDRPLHLFFCAEHGDIDLVVQRYLAQRTGETVAVG